MLQEVKAVTSHLLPYVSEAMEEKVVDAPEVTDEPEGEITALAAATA
jgi:hypothetical protein